VIAPDHQQFLPRRGIPPREIRSSTLNPGSKMLPPAFCRGADIADLRAGIGTPLPKTGGHLAS
jgi:hypothetical protein